MDNLPYYQDRLEALISARWNRLEQMAENSSNLSENFAEIIEEGSFFHVWISESHYAAQHNMEYLDFYAGIFAMREGFYLDLCEDVADLLGDDHVARLDEARKKKRYSWGPDNSLGFIESITLAKCGFSFDRSIRERVDQGRMIRNKIMHSGGGILSDEDTGDPLYDLKLWKLLEAACKDILEIVSEEMNNVISKTEEALTVMQVETIIAL